MPNKCHDTLKVTGPASKLARFKQLAAGGSSFRRRVQAEAPDILNFNSLLPMPKDLLPSRCKDKLDDWKRENWGCRGALDVSLATETSTTLVYDFWTAWSPPLRLIQRLSTLWTQCHFEVEYFIVHSWISGTARAHKGVLKHNYIDFSMERDEAYRSGRKVLSTEDF